MKMIKLIDKMYIAGYIDHKYWQTLLNYYGPLIFKEEYNETEQTSTGQEQGQAVS